MKNLNQALLLLKNNKEVSEFLNDLCTPAELKAMNERWAVAQLLYKDEMSYREIASKLNASTTTITRVPAAAVSWAEELPEATQASAMRQSIEQWTRQDAEAQLLRYWLHCLHNIHQAKYAEDLISMPSPMAKHTEMDLYNVC